MRAAIYSRVSTKHHEQNPDIQRQELIKYCQARGWSVEHDIVDHGFSGGTDKRPGLRELNQLVKLRTIDCVVVLKLDRLFRSLRHLVTVLEEYEALGIKFVAVKDNVDYTTPSGRLFVQILGSLAEFEKSLLKERTMLGLEYARQNGKVLGRPKVRDDARIVALKTQGLSYREIAKRLGISRGAVYRALKTGSKTQEISKPQINEMIGGQNA